MHTGEGTQNNYFWTPSMADAKGRDPRRQAADELAWLRRIFVEPDGYGRAIEILEKHRTVFLDGSPGSGRTMTAQMLLWEPGPVDDRLHELPLEEPKKPRRIDLTHVGDDDRVWLDLSTVDQPAWVALQPELSELRKAVRDNSAQLVVVLPSPVRDLKSEFGPYCVKIKRPSPEQVFGRCLRAYEFEPAVPPSAQVFLSSNPPLGRIARFVQLVIEARETSRGQGDFAGWCEAALNALSGQMEEAAALVQELTGGRQRALLLSAAMLHQAHADVIDQAASALMQRAQQQPDDRSVLEHSTLDTRFKEIGAELDGEGHIRFSRLDFDSAVRLYFWTQLPTLRTTIKDWVGEVAAFQGLSDTERGGLIANFADLCLHERHREFLTMLVWEWTEHSPSPEKSKAAALALLRGLHDQQHGRFFRKKIYEWSRQTGLSDRLAQLLVVACRDEISIRHPDEALVRLHHLARRERGTSSAREALLWLTHQDRRFLRQLLPRLTESNPETRHHATNIELFLELADPAVLTKPGRSGRPLIVGKTIRAQLTAGWELSFATSPHESWAPLAWRWLGHAAADPLHRHDLLDVLVAGGARRMDILSRLYVMSLGRDLRPVLSDLVRQKIENAQGLPRG
ncbi:hypothetical protein ACIBF1_17235 [Spirillospora sp. NPDC050679]